MPDNIDGGLKRTIGLGMEAEAFMTSPLGEAILDIMDEAAITAMEKLKTLKPSDFDSLEQYARAVQDAQNEVYRAEGFVQWLLEIVETGRNTEENVLQAEADEQS